MVSQQTQRLRARKIFPLCRVSNKDIDRGPYKLRQPLCTARRENRVAVLSDRAVRIRPCRASPGIGPCSARAQRRKAAMNRELVWIEHPHFGGWGCSQCAWVFKSSTGPIGKSFDRWARNAELQRDSEFTMHVCADHPRTTSTKRRKED